MSAEGQSRAWMLTVTVSTALLLAVAAGAAVGSLMAQRATGVVPVVDSGGTATRLSAVVAQPAQAASGETEGPAGDPVAINSVGGSEDVEPDAEPDAEPTKEEAGASPDADSKTGERMEPKVDLDKMRDKLSPEQFAVCFNAATEPAFSGKYWDHHEPGAYHCVACDTPLFSSNHKFDSGTGWPSFSEAVYRGSIATHEDRSHGMLRTEVLCGNCGAHLGHLFPDGPQPTGQRYCINSAALEFREDEAQQ